MKLNVVFCLALLVAAATSTSLLNQYPLNYKSSLGSVFAQVQAAMKAGGPMQNVLKMLDDFKNTIIREQANHQAVRNKQHHECRVAKRFRRREVANGKSAMQVASANIKTATGRLHVVKRDLKFTRGNLANTRAQLKRTISIRVHQRAVFAARGRHHKAGIINLHEALRILDEIWSGTASFAELNALSSKLLLHSVKTNTVADVAPVLSMFAQIAVDRKILANNAALENIRRLLKRLLGNYRASYRRYAAKDQKREIVYRRWVKRLEHQIRVLVKTIRRLIRLKQSLRQYRIVQRLRFHSAVRKVQRNQQLLDDARKMCRNFHKVFEFATVNRNQELKLIAQIRAIVVRRFKMFSAGAMARGSKAVHQWRKYKNRTIHRKGHYKFKPITFNAAGAAYAKFKRQQALEQVQLKQTNKAK